jgi:hypothetical protein
VYDESDENFSEVSDDPDYLEEDRNILLIQIHSLFQE